MPKKPGESIDEILGRFLHTVMLLRHAASEVQEMKASTAECLADSRRLIAAVNMLIHRRGTSP